MSCTRRFMNVEWDHHSWHPRVTSSEIMTSQETNMWARVVYRDYVRCDKEEVCAVCGQARRQASCICDMERAAQCKLRNEWIAEAPEVMA